MKIFIFLEFEFEFVFLVIILFFQKGNWEEKEWKKIVNLTICVNN
jgi:hypothetical protein